MLMVADLNTEWSEDITNSGAFIIFYYPFIILTNIYKYVKGLLGIQQFCNKLQ